VWPIERVTAEDEVRARDVLRRYEDKDFSYVDATSFAVMERLRIREAFAFDPHFVQYGLRLFG
jgi:predicted nucleic acid-binding protein